MSSYEEKPISNKSLSLRLLAMTIGMFGFGFLVLPPLYNVFCEITGFGGRANAAAIELSEVETYTSGRDIRLEFETTVNEYAPWTFESIEDAITVKVGGIYETSFVARNLANQEMTAQAVPSISPPQASKYFKKLECFCFTTQEFAAHEEKEMVVRYVVDSDLPEYIDTITLSYTFFDTARIANSSDSKSDSTAKSLR